MDVSLSPIDRKQSNRGLWIALGLFLVVSVGFGFGFYTLLSQLAHPPPDSDQIDPTATREEPEQQ